MVKSDLFDTVTANSYHSLNLTDASLPIPVFGDYSVQNRYARYRMGSPIFERYHLYICDQLHLKSMVQVLLKNVLSPIVYMITVERPMKVYTQN